MAKIKIQTALIRTTFCQLERGGLAWYVHVCRTCTTGDNRHLLRYNSSRRHYLRQPSLVDAQCLYLPFMSWSILARRLSSYSTTILHSDSQIPRRVLAGNLISSGISQQQSFKTRRQRQTSLDGMSSWSPRSTPTFSTTYIIGTNTIGTISSWRPP